MLNNEINVLVDIDESHFDDICIFLDGWPKPIIEIKYFAKFVNKKLHFIFNNEEKYFTKDIYNIE